ncbi:MAG: OmpA family protein [Saprospiraceae bacterium]|nr:OmpA family protein [Saprospiraceae bacterium]
MGINLMEMVKDAVGDQLVNQASGFLGESAENTSSAVGAMLPAILGGLMKKGSDAQGAQGILDFMQNSNIDGGILDSLGGLFGGGAQTNGLLSAGGGILDFLFGNNSSMLGSVLDLITKRSGIGSGSSSSLMKMVAPLLMGVVGRYVKNKALDAVGLSNLLGSQKEHVQKAAPAGLFDKMGLGALGAIANSVTGAGQKVVDTGKAAVGATTAAAGTAAKAGADTVKAGAAAGSNLFSKILPWLILAAAALGLLWFMKGCGGQVGDAAGSVLDQTEQLADKAGDMAGDVAGKVGDAAGAAVDAAGNAVNAVGDAISSISLPGGAEISAAAGSFTDRMAKFLAGGDGDAATRFTFDGVNFATGSANLTEESMTQLQNLASIMKSYPNVKIRVEGHTDNTGDANANMNLSQQRALSVKRALNELGVANDRVEAQGKGQNEPVASNDTEEGRLQNRRVDVFVTSK